MFSNPATCSHSDVAEVRWNEPGAELHDTVIAYVCKSCLTSLSVSWTCEDCEWLEEWSLASSTPEYIRARACLSCATTEAAFR